MTKIRGRKRSELMMSYHYRGFELGRRDFDAGNERKYKAIFLQNAALARNEREALASGYTDGYRPISEVTIQLDDA